MTDQKYLMVILREKLRFLEPVIALNPLAMFSVTGSVDFRTIDQLEYTPALFWNQAGRWNPGVPNYSCGKHNFFL